MLKRNGWLFFFALPLAALPQPQESQPTATFDQLEIVIDVQPDGQLMETRRGTFHLNTDELRILQSLSIPNLDGSRAASLDLVLLRNGQSIPVEAPEPEANERFYTWRIPQAELGDVLQFATRQRIDFRENPGGGWWLQYTPEFIWPVNEGSVTLRLPEGFTGSVDSLQPTNSGSGFEWNLSGARRDASGDTLFVVSSFADWGALSGWTLSQCEAGPDARIDEFANAGGPTEIAMAVKDALMLDEGAAVACRDISEVLDSGEATDAEAAMVLAAALDAAGHSTTRYLVTPYEFRDAPNPVIFDRLFVRITSGSGKDWFDPLMPQLEGAVWPETGSEAALPLQTAGASWIAPLFADPNIRVGEDGLDMEVTAEVSQFGEMNARATVTNLRESYVFLDQVMEKGRLLEPDTMVNEGSHIGPIVSNLVFRDADFLLPLERARKVRMQATPLAQSPVRLSDGGVFIGMPGVYREHMDLELPPGRRDPDPVHLSWEASFGNYQSDADVVDGHLIVNRVLKLNTWYVPREEANVARRDLSQVTTDQEREFVFQRQVPVDWPAWVESVAPEELTKLGTSAMTQGEFEAAILLLQRAVELNPNDSEAWGSLGFSLEEVNREYEAKDALERAARVDPKSRFYLTYVTHALMLKDGEKVLADAQARAERDPEDQTAWSAISSSAQALGRWDLAEEALVRQMPLANQARRNTLEIGLTYVRACQGTLADPEETLRNTMGPPNAAMLIVVVDALTKCDKYPLLTGQFCEQLLRGMNPYAAATLTDPHRLMGFQMSEVMEYTICGRRDVWAGDVDRGLERLYAATRLSTSADPMRAVAQSFWENGRSEQAVQLWAEAFAYDPDILPTVPEEVRGAVRDAKPPIVFPLWTRVGGHPLGLDELVQEGDEWFFLARADEDGVVARLFDVNAIPQPEITAALEGMLVPEVVVDGRGIPNVEVLRVRRVGGDVELDRSTSAQAFATVSAMQRALDGPVATAVPSGIPIQ